MRPLLLALPLSLALVGAHAEEHDHDHGHTHDNPGAHEHGAALLDVVLEDRLLSIELHSPAINLVGFEHRPGNDAERAEAARARQALATPLALFGLPATARCTVSLSEQSSPLFADDAQHDHDAHEHGHEDEHGEHADIDARYRMTCADTEQLEALDLTGFFETFPRTERLQVQLIGPNGQRGLQLEPGDAAVPF